MDNRRQHDRLPFPAAERPPVLLELPDRRRRLTAALLDLGERGMRVRLEKRTRPPGLDDTLLAHLDLSPLRRPLAISCAVVYLERIGPWLDCGVQFLPLLHPTAEEARTRLLRRYLGAEQRRRRKTRRGSGLRLRLFTGD